MAGNTTAHGRSVTSKVVAILDTFSRGDAHSLTEIAVLTGLPLSTVHRLVMELTSFGVLERTEDAWYRVGARLATIGSGGVRAPMSASWLQIVRRVMEDISAATGTSVRFGVLESLRVAFIEKPVNGDGPSDFAGAVEWAGALPAHATALGKALLAFSPPDIVDGVIAHGLKRYTPTTLTEPDRLRHSLKEVRLTGVAVSDSEMSPAVPAIAAPVFAAGGCVVAALELRLRNAASDHDRLRPALLVAARSLSRELQNSHASDGRGGRILPKR
jgi:DNA-binding IclR family transcriptional regulator